MKRKQNFKFILYIIGLFTSLLYVSPFYILIVNAFKTKKDLFESTLKLPAIWTFKNFETAATKLSLLSEANSFWSSSLFNSLFITIFSVIVTIIFTSMAAWMLVRTKSKVSTFIFFMFIAAMLVPFQAVMLPLVALAGKTASKITVNAKEITGTEAQILDIYIQSLKANFTGLGNKAVTVTGAVTDVYNLNAILKATSGVVTAAIAENIAVLKGALTDAKGIISSFNRS